MLRSLLIVGIACSDGPGAPDAADAVDAEQADASEDASIGDRDVPADGGATDAGLRVLVTLDGVPIGDALVVQGGSDRTWRTGADGWASIDLDLGVEGQLVVMGSHPEARIRAADVGRTATATIALARFDRSDNPDYRFQDPGEPSRRTTTSQCGHCHIDIDDGWFESPHRTSASNAHLWDLYLGTSGPGVIGLGTFGGCADCHAPGIDGVLGGRDLREAAGFALDYGVHCDVCHRIERVTVGGAPAFGGWLSAVRPSEPGPRTLGAGGLLPLTFGPSHDSPNPRMGSVQRDHFREAPICGGCHQLEQGELAGGIDRARWPSGRLPIHTTFEEWEASPMNPASPCQECHMPPNAMAVNAANLEHFPNATIGIQGGWHRPPGSVRHHSFVGPRTPSSGMLELAAAIRIVRSLEGGVLTATVTVKNVGPGHAIPTGEPLRSLILLVDAECGAPLEAIGGDAVPWFGGSIAAKESGDFTDWPAAEVGDVVRVVRYGPYVDYAGFGPFGDGTFDATEKGIRREIVAGSATVTAVNPIAFDRGVPSGDAAYLTRGGTSAGRPGFAFARVLADAAGETMVPHFLATDVVADNRLLPQQSFSTNHRFDAAACAAPIVHARLVYRRFPLELAAERRWDPGDRIIAEAER
jgi:hypothetical protein